MNEKKKQQTAIYAQNNTDKDPKYSGKKENITYKDT